MKEDILDLRQQVVNLERKIEDNDEKVVNLERKIADKEERETF